jgi:3-dehydroquinate synthase
MRDIDVHLGHGRNRSYAIRFVPKLIETLPTLVDRHAPGRRPIIITDRNVRRVYGKRLLASFDRIGRSPLLCEVPAGEQSKNADLVFELHTALLRAGVQRDNCIIAFGGGVVGDLAGFVAATILRGIDYLQVPTTLLAQVDSSVGGKVGIDHPVGKNLIGAFHQPRAVYIDTTLLTSLPERQFRAGLAEVVKIAVALDATLYRQIARNAARLRRTSPGLVEDLVARSVGLKAMVVVKDEFEKGLRKALNLGHTIGHAIESASGFRLLHGEAVSIGIAAESQLAVGLGLMRNRDRESLLETLRALHLPTALPKLPDPRRFLEALHADKKSERGTPRFVLPAGIGQCAIGVEVPDTMILRLFRRTSP